ncbi:MAG: cold shock domain-containing protein [Bacteroidales bacterium]|nr:cold shock domain-containing protein [Bacteroidales bacterium]
MGRSQESFNKKEVRNKKAKKRKEKEEKKQAKKGQEKNSFEDMIAYVDEFGVISSTPPDPKRKKTVINPDDIVLGATVREPDPTQGRERKGIVTFFNDSKGYGFIRDLATGESVFVHANSVAEPITEGNTVSFEIGAGQKGPAANNVKIVR